MQRAADADEYGDFTEEHKDKAKTRQRLKDLDMRLSDLPPASCVSDKEMYYAVIEKFNLCFRRHLLLI